MTHSEVTSTPGSRCLAQCRKNHSCGRAQQGNSRPRFEISFEHKSRAGGLHFPHPSPPPSPQPTPRTWSPSASASSFVVCPRAVNRFKLCLCLNQSIALLCRKRSFHTTRVRSRSSWFCFPVLSGFAAAGKVSQIRGCVLQPDHPWGAPLEEGYQRQARSSRMFHAGYCHGNSLVLFPLCHFFPRCHFFMGLLFGFPNLCSPNCSLRAALGAGLTSLRLPRLTKVVAWEALAHCSCFPEPFLLLKSVRSWPLCPGPVFDRDPRGPRSRIFPAPQRDPPTEAPDIGAAVSLHSRRPCLYRFHGHLPLRVCACKRM